MGAGDINKNELVEYTNCLLSALYYICETNGRNPIYLFANNYGMDYIKGEAVETISERVRPHISMRFENYIEQIYNFKCDTLNFDAFRMNVDALVPEDFILVGLDAYFCPWNKAFNKAHIFHYCLLKEICCDTMICDDPFLRMTRIEWPVDLFISGYKAIYKLKKQKEEMEISIYKILKVLLKNTSKNKINLNYHNFIEDLSNVRKKEELFEVEDPNICKLVIFSKQISNNYKGLSIMLDEMQTQCKVSRQFFSRDVICNIFKMGELWDTLNKVFIKMMVMPEINNKRIYTLIEILKNIKDMDNDVYDSLVEITESL